MIKQISNTLKLTYLAIASLVLLCGGLVLFTAQTQAATSDRICDGANLSLTPKKLSPAEQAAKDKAVAEGTAGVCDNPGEKTADKKLNEIIKLVIDIFSVVVGIVAVIMIIIGGFKYITSGGDSGKLTSAKNTILYAIVGLVIVVLAQLIVKFVLNNVPDQPKPAPTSGLYLTSTNS